MELLGGLVERVGLTGDESLAEIIKSGIIGIAPFPLNGQMYIQEVHDCFIQRAEKQQQKIKTALEVLTREIPLPSQEEDFDSTRNELVAEYLSCGIEAYFDRISPDLFDIKRKIEAEVKDRYDSTKKNLVEIPLFANARLDQSEWNCPIVSNDGTYTHKIDIKSFVPPITKEAKEKVKAFQAIYMEAISKSLREPLIGDIVMRDLQSKVAEADLSVFWIPKPSDLRIKVETIDNDPFIAASVYNRKYLVSRWNVDGELPYEHYLKEFGISGIRNATPIKIPNSFKN